jgi:hypothetical protein
VIHYKHQSDGNIAVYLDRHRVGTIIVSVDGFTYNPKHNPGLGVTFKTLRECKDSIE